MKSLIFFSLLLTCVHSLDFFSFDHEWSLFKKTYSKKYLNFSEEKYRYGIYLSNKLYIDFHNKLAASGTYSYTLKMNKFGDLSLREFNILMNGYKPDLKSPLAKAVNYKSPANFKIPDCIDWRKKGYVTEVKDQGLCGSCWAFSSTGSLEGQLFRFTGNLSKISEQNLIDCSHDYGNEGCSGGLMSNSFTYIERNHGIDSEKKYPYKAKEDKCHYVKKFSIANDEGYCDLPFGDEKFLKEAVAAVGPISVAIDASQDTFQFYKKGVYDEPACSEDYLNHAVLVVGYGKENNVSYWLVKNSWGLDWGEKGYIKMSRNKKNQCGIASEASYPLFINPIF